MADSLSIAMLVVLESLSPEQRAVLLLREVFDYGYQEIARIVGKSEDNVRQIAVRARRHVDQRRPRFQTSREQRDELARRFFAAVHDGDVGGLEALLAHDIVLTGDGGGKVPALARSLQGRSRVARTLLNWVKLGARVPEHRSGQPRSTAHPARCCSTVIGAWSRSGRSRSPAVRSRAIRSIVTRASSPTSDRWRISVRCCALAGDLSPRAGTSDGPG